MPARRRAQMSDDGEENRVAIVKDGARELARGTDAADDRCDGRQGQLKRGRADEPPGRRGGASMFLFRNIARNCG